MVVFHCGSCGEALKKNQVDKHIGNNCRRVQKLSCIDCGKDFDRNSYKEHTKCVTEQEKYGGSNYTAPSNMNKGEKKQNQWFEIVQSAINLNTGSNQAKILLKKLQYYPNTPRKRAKFINFTNNSVKGFPPRVVEEVWSILEGLLPKPGNNEGNQSKKIDSEDQEQNASENASTTNNHVNQSQTKRSREESTDGSPKKQKTNGEHAAVSEQPEEESTSSNLRFEWYDEIKLALSKATDQTLSLEALKKKIAKRYKKLKPTQEKNSDDLFKKLEKKLSRAPFVQQIEPHVFRLVE